jgi:hypothetical protein
MYASELGRTMHITILGLGPSLEEYVNITKRLGGRHVYSDEVWGINAVGGVIQCDRIFHMDDVRIQEVRAAARPESNIAQMLKWMQKSKTPIITSRKHKRYPALVEFPLEEVMNHLKYDYFNNTAAYALAYAIYIGATKVSVFGCDYTYPNAHDAERGRACLEFWLGYAAAKGIAIAIPKVSSLMDALYPQQDRLYGYDTVTIAMDKVDDYITVNKTFHDRLPTADEIEDRYDHEKHPNALIKD